MCFAFVFSATEFQPFMERHSSSYPKHFQGDFSVLFFVSVLFFLAPSHNFHLSVSFFLRGGRL